VLILGSALAAPLFTVASLTLTGDRLLGLAALGVAIGLGIAGRLRWTPDSLGAPRIRRRAGIDDHPERDGLESSLKTLCDGNLITYEDALGAALDARELGRLMGRS
jgi:hypothetical protein